MNRIFYKIIFFALMLQAMIPIGYMPAFSQGGGMSFVICSGLSGEAIEIFYTADDTGNEPLHNPEEDISMECAYGNVLPQAIATPPIIHPQLSMAVFIPHIIHNDVILKSISVSHPSRAPPAFSV